MLPETLFPNPGAYTAYLRDWFAGQALASLGDWTPIPDDMSELDFSNPPVLREHRARWAYAMADAMMEARKDAPHA